MHKARQKTTGQNAPVAKRRAKKQIDQTPRSLMAVKNGIHTADDFINLFGALMGDVLDNRLPPEIANAVSNAGGRLLKAVDMQYRYGVPDASGRRNLELLMDGNNKQKIRLLKS